MSAFLRTRDGSFSAVALIHAAEDARLGVIEVDAEQAVEWARANGVTLVAGEGAGAQMARINAERREYQLPIMVLKGRRREERPTSTIAEKAGNGAGGGKQARPKSGPAPQIGGCMVNSTTQMPGDGQSRGEQEVLPASATTGIPAVSPPCESVPLPQPVVPIVASQDDLLLLVTEFNGTRTGYVTPEVAGWLLALNTGNRPLLQAAVERFVRIIRNGQWKLTGEAVIVSQEGVLNDGQHRLEAVVRAGQPVLMDIRFGINRDAFAVTGTGTRRTASQALAIAGGKHSASQAAVARLLHWFDAKQMARCSMQVEPDEVIRIVSANPQILEVVALQKKCRFAPARTAPVGLILAVAARQMPLERVSAFLVVVDSGLADDEHNAARRLHVRLRDAAMSKERLSQVDAAALTARAWNAWHVGRALQHLRVDERDRASATFPEVLA